MTPRNFYVKTLYKILFKVYNESMEYKKLERWVHLLGCKINRPALRKISPVIGSIYDIYGDETYHMLCRVLGRDSEDALNDIRAVKHISIRRFFSGILDGVGMSTMFSLVGSGYDTVEKIMSIGGWSSVLHCDIGKTEDISFIRGIGSVRCRHIQKEIRSKALLIELMLGKIKIIK